MQAKSPDEGRTVTELARRAQIVEAAIETIAELGYPRVSFAQIAKRAGLSSTGLISYHFAGKRELMAQVVERIYGEIGAFMTERMKDQPTAREALCAYIEGNVEFTGTHGTRMKALLDIFINGDLHYDADSEQIALSPLEEILRWGQATGEFRDFDVTVMATTLRRAVEGPAFLLTANPGLDLKSYARELVTLFDRATGKEG